MQHISQRLQAGHKISDFFIIFALIILNELLHKNK